ncbi:MAG: type I restriction-modification system subunit M [Tissierellia bacterium]|nr:type I restriction-modification system subunit M [Tissierellia bacterium]
MRTSEDIKRRLWNGANELRGSMDASRYKDYMLGLMFYKFLSDRTLQTFANLSGNNTANERELMSEYKNMHKEYQDQLDETIRDTLGYVIKPDYLYQKWVEDINAGEFELQNVSDSLSNFERTITASEGSNQLKGLFSASTLDLTDTALGSNLKNRSDNIKALITLFADLDMISLQKGDVLGDAYEYLIGMFAMESGKKAGEFYTPRQVSEVMAQIVAKSSNIKSIYDPTVGSGSLLLTVKKHLKESAQKDLKYYGQEKNTATYNLTRMNLLLHGVRPEMMEIRNGDTLAEDWPEDPERPDEGVQFDAVVMNPPYSLKNWNRAGLKVSDPRFELAGVLPPNSKGDFAFLLHGLFHLGQEGTMAIVLPHGVLFRGASEGEIRKRLLEKNYIDTIIGLPNNLFTNTGIPVVVIILKKNRKLGEPVLIIDASKNFIKVGKQNALQEKDIAKIVDTYLERSEIKGYSHLADRDEIIENEFNLNIPRYIESIDEEIPHDVDAHLYGGIPVENLKELKILNSTVKDTLEESFEPVRENYVKLNKSIEDLTKDILNDEKVIKKSEKIAQMSKDYIEKYWNRLKSIDRTDRIHSLMEEMLLEIKTNLQEFEYIDIYDGYQIIAEIWQNNLASDAELIALNGFYKIGRSREENIVTKGSGKNKREVQEGWNGSLIPNEIIKENLFKEEVQKLEELKNRLAETESEIAELIEAAKEEETDENIALYDALRRNAEDEVTDSFDVRALKTELSNAEKGSLEYNLLKKATDLLAKRTKLNREIKSFETKLDNEVEDRILVLTDAEIDDLVYEKWFGETEKAFVNLVEAPLKEELEILKMLNERYEDTLSDIDSQIRELEAEFEKILAELVVVK